jgi:POT family proton-dependent oligopeptide transporter
MKKHAHSSAQERHPRGMYILAFTELFERLSYYTLSFLLVLFASDTVAHGGLGWTKEAALGITSMYTFAAFTLPVFCGFLADRYFGAFKSAVFGASLIMLGHIVMYFADAEQLTVFYMALFSVALGTAFFKPCLPSMLGKLYPKQARIREAGFSYYYMGINFGAMIAGISSGLLLQRFGYRVALSSAAVGMALGLSVFLAGRKHLEPLVEHKETPIKKKECTSKTQNKAIAYLCYSYIFVACWAFVYNIAISGTLSLYIENYTQKTVLGFELPTTFFLSLESVGILLAAPALIFIYKYLGERRSPHFFTQMNIAVLLSTAALCFLTYMAYKVTDVEMNANQNFFPFMWYDMAFLILIVSISEVMISPVMMSAISVLSPEKYKTLFQSFYLFIIGIMGLVAGKVGAFSLSQPFETFLYVTIIAALLVALYAVTRKSMVTVAMKAVKEKC